ncbi:T9SS type B sorting domain-containing protein [Seonamhaeicola aphaedonensis]|uniref:Gliding motility-associated-like protein n=1 Tax=Seonamhaeicola aphaedonensis TaxID=1461338 RepID=A0A3D9HIP7_9FLAO|nr:T9SS type B sorting domain-containing protein [Seonamhaeicola aphaedonensis]RED49314.1 gliding motility-associated-like protein [Seonamhaeicola aphaedonensis]
MKKTTYVSYRLVVILLLFGIQLSAQTYEPFSLRKNVEVRGSMLVVGNATLGESNNDFNDLTKDNQDISMQYIDIDSDASTFSSSSADLSLHLQPDGSATTCYRVAYAGLYWGAILQSGSRSDINQVKFKLPGSTNYTDITGEIIYDAIASPIIAETGEPGNTPYACYAEVTDLLTGLSNVEGTYTVANVTSSLGLNNSTGLAAGWTLIVIYEDPNLHTKSFNIFDGFSHIYNGHQETVPVTGFATPPAGNIDLQFAYAALDGDRTKRATKLEINGKEVTTPLRSANKFFGSVIENENGVSHPRVPYSDNTLGYDTGFLEILNSEPEFIKNGDTSADFRLQVARGQADPIFAFLGAFAVDIIAPDIHLTKVVLDTSGDDIDGDDVYLGDQLFYEITYQSVGNDNVTEFTIKDVLPDNIVFDPTTDIDLTNAGGATLQSWDPVTRTLIFSIPDQSVEVDDPAFVIRLAVQVVPNCYDLSQACSNEIMNQAFATYRGVINPTIIEEEGSFATVECLGVPGSTNFIVDISDCDFTRTEILCGSSVVLTAASGYDNYSWSTSPTGTPVIGTGQTYTATEVGTYYVTNTTTSTCISIQEAITVALYGTTQTNPVIPYADQVVTCPNDGKQLPYIFLCGANETRTINTGISDAASIVWEQLDENSCPAMTIDDCANENDACTWSQVATGPDYTANAAGEFRLVITYPGGCFSVFYFNVYQNLLNPTISAEDIICTTLGSVTVGGVPSGYEYSLDPNGTYQSSNTFAVNTPGYYTVYIQQTVADSFPCTFQTPSIYVRQRDANLTTVVTQPDCNGDKGSIQLQVNDALPQYYYSLSQGGTLVNSVGPIMDSNYTFADLNPGTYTYTVTTDDGCIFTGDIDIISPPVITVTAALTQPLTCTDGEITIYPVGGTPPYNYFINSTTVSQDYPEYIVTTAGTYNITVIDFNGCEASTSITVDEILPPEFNINQNNILCADDPNSGSITVNVVNANGNGLMYSIDGGTTFVSSNVFSGLSAGSYDVVVQYSYDTDICATVAQTITITTQAPITGTATLTTPLTCTTSGVITISGVTGGTSPYEYSIDGVNFQVGNTFSGLTNGTYTVTVRDASGCSSALAPITIDALDPPTDMAFSSTPLTCPSNTSDVTITSIIGGTAPLEYQIMAPSGLATAYQSSNIFTGLAPGTYTFQIRDANDCTYSESFTIDPLPALTVVGQALSNVTCFGASDGSAQFTVSGTSGFTYTINGGASTAGASPISLSGLASGNYVIVITDTTTNCTATDTLSISGPPSALIVSATESPITCNADGSVIINASGGWGSYSYELEQPDSTVLGPQGSIMFGGLTQSGIYTITVTDANSCTVTTTFNLSSPSNPTATIINADYCFDGTNASSFEVSASGGNPPYEYSINGSVYQSSPIFSNLIPGTYDITVRDAFGCTFALPTETIADQITASASLIKGLDCTVNPDAEVDVSVSGGTAPYTYEMSFNGGAFSVTGNPTYVYNNTQIGDYQYRVTDALGCVALTNVVTIQPITNPSAIATATDVFCNGDASGIVSIDIDETLGVPPYLVSFNGSGFTSQTVYNGLTTGSYNYIVQDANSCVFNGSVTVNEPNAITLGSEIITPITCGVGGNVLGAIQILNITGGVPNYTYTLLNSSGAVATTSSTNPFGPTPNDNVIFNDLTFGSYYLRIIDGNGCEYNFGPYLVASDVDNLDINTSAGGTCIAGVSYNIEIINGTGPFRVRIYDGTTTFSPTDGVTPNGLPVSNVSPNERNHQFSGLLFDVSYVFEVLDTSTGCTYIEQVPAIPSPSSIAVTGTPTDVTCYELPALNNGSFDFTVTGYDGADLTWEVFENLTNTTTGITGSVLGLGGANYSDSVSGLAPGDYYLLVSETDLGSTQCTAIVNFQIKEPTELILAEVTNINANCNQDAQVAVNAGGGTPPYEYAFVVDGTIPSAGDWTSSSLAFLDPTASNDWDVYVRDLNGCNIALPLDVTITDDTLPTVTVPAIADDQCTSYGGSYTFTAVPGGGEVTPVTYSIDGVNFQSSTTFIVSTPGTYTVTIRDGNGCTATDSITIYPPIQINAQVSALPSCNNNDGIITVTGYGGSGNYTYEITSGPILSGPQVSNVFNSLPSGTFTITIADTTTACTDQIDVILDAATPVIFTPVATNVSCNGGNDGTITVNLAASNDNPPYIYEITSGPVLMGAQNSNIFTGLPAGTYDITVTSGRNCITTEPVVIGEPLLLGVSGLATDFACAPDNSVNTSTLTITESGGTAPFAYSIDGINYFTTNTFNIIDTGSVQTIDIYVRDANGCTASSSVNINPLPALNMASAAIATPIDCNNTGTVSISVTGGSGNFSYQLLPSGTSQVSNTFTITAPGTYYFQVNDLDTGCSIDTPALTIAPFDIIEAIATATTAITCFGDNNGAFEFSVNGYSGAYNYEVFNSSGVSVSGVLAGNTSTNPQVVNGMNAGSYYVEITETASPFCSTTTNMITIDSPITALMLSLSETSNVTCNDNQGTITAIASGGWGDYQYELTGTATVPYSSNGTFTNLTAGSYIVNVMDAGGCIVSENITLNLPTPIDATILATPTLLNCFGDANATITINNVTGGQGGNYSYTLNMIAPTVSTSGPQTSPVFNGLGAGTYNVTVTDGYNCSYTTPDVVIDEPTQIIASLVATSTQTCVNDATLTLSATGGTGTYEYSNTDTFTTVLGSFNSSITFPVSPGTYEYYIRDANGCVASVSNSITIEPIDPLTINLDITNATVNCAGDSTGVIVAEAQGGLGNYIYTLQDGSGNDILGAIQNSPGVFTDLPIGTYQVHVESVDCEVTSATVIITEPSEPLVAQFTVTDITCNGENDGIIEVLASGGTGIIKYAITPRLDQFFDEPLFDELASGFYDIIVQDELGCYVLLEDIEVVEAAPVILSIVQNSILPEVCEGDMNGEFSIDISGGSLPYSVALDDINGAYTMGAPTQTIFDFTGLNGGDHIVYVIDAQGCESEWNITFPESVRLDPSVEVEYCTDVADASSNAVTVILDSSVDPAEVDYSLDGVNFQTNNIFIDLPAGLNQSITVRHTNGCEQVAFFDIIQYDPLEIALSDGTINEILAQASGGSGNYEYAIQRVNEVDFEPYKDTGTFIIYESGEYTVTVTDSNGCIATASRYFEFIDVCITNYFVPRNGGWGPGCTTQYRNLTFDIFDRYGRKIATLGVDEKWDGTYNGKELPTGDYWYVVKLNDAKDKREFVGHFTLYR